MEIVIAAGEEPLVRKMTVTFASTAVDQEADKMIAEKAKTERLPGFQPNKPLPLKVVKNYFGKRIRQYVLEEVWQKTFYEAIEEKKLKPASPPKLLNLVDMEGGQITVEVSFEVYPDIQVQGLESVAVEKEIVNISDADVEKMINTLRKQFAAWEEVDRPAQNDDEVTINFKGELDGVAFHGGSADDVPLILGSGQMIEGFESGLVGAKKGETRDLNLTFPAEYHAKDLAGKAVVFHVELTKVSARELPPIDAGLAEKLGAKDLSTLNQDVRANMEREIKFALTARVRDAVLNALAERNDFDLPVSAIEFERHNMYRETLQRMGLKPEQMKQLPPLPESMYLDEAKKRIKLGLIVSYYIEHESLKASPESIKARVEQLSSVYEQPAEVVKYYYDNPDRLKDVEFMVLEENVVDFCLSRCKVTEKQVNFFDIIKPKEQGR